MLSIYGGARPPYTLRWDHAFSFKSHRHKEDTQPGHCTGSHYRLTSIGRR